MPESRTFTLAPAHSINDFHAETFNESSSVRRVRYKVTNPLGRNHVYRQSFKFFNVDQTQAPGVPISNFDEGIDVLPVLPGKRVTIGLRNNDSIPQEVEIELISTDDVAATLAQAHREADPKTNTVKYFPGGPPIRLIEVSSEAPTTGEILPFEFPEDRANGVVYSSIVVLLSPEEWDDVQNGALPLPTGWDLYQARDV